MPDYHSLPGIAMPMPAHTLTPAAEHARQAVRDFAARRNHDRTKLELVTTTPKPWHLVPSPSTLSGAPVTLANAARAAGLEVELWQAGQAVEVRIDGGRIRAWWVAGKTTGALVDGHKANVTQAKAAL